MPERSGGGPPGSKVGKLKSVLSEKSEVKDSPWSPAGSAGFLLALQFAVIKSAACSPKPGRLNYYLEPLAPHRSKKNFTTRYA